MVAVSLKSFISLLSEAGVGLYIGENPEEAEIRTAINTCE
jgi:hypothetical protein